ncbi:MAG: hypothetical protein U0175_24450 [Caldilineaceae bacterium]
MSRLVILDLPDPVYEKFSERSKKTHRTIEDELLTAFALNLPMPTLALHTEYSAYDEVLDFLSTAPSPLEIIDFQLSDKARQRASFLLQKQRQQSLTAAEEDELDAYVELGDFLGILRAKTQLKLHKRGLL